jgi:hypothetical protein
MFGRASDEEGLRLILAFFSIMEPDKRNEVVELAERLAEQSQVVPGVSHFSMLPTRLLKKSS